MTVKDYIYGVIKGNNLIFVDKQYYYKNETIKWQKEEAVHYFCTGVDASTNLNIVNYVPENVLDTCRGILDACDYLKESPTQFIIKNKYSEANIDYLMWHIGRDYNIVKKMNDLGISLYDMMDIYMNLYVSADISCVQTHDFYKMLTYGYQNPSVIKFKKTHPSAVAPKKNMASDSGFDLVLIEKIKEVNGVSYYDTGIQVAPPIGYYFDLVGRSSISKSGYMLANNVGIIDQSYRGNIIVALVKVNTNVPDLELPMRLVQIIPRKVHAFSLEEVNDIDSTSRGDKGFGSSGC